MNNTVEINQYLAIAMILGIVLMFLHLGYSTIKTTKRLSDEA